MSTPFQLWVESELVSTGAFSHDEAHRAARAFATDARLDDTAAAVAVARATKALPNGREWWIEERRKHLILGKPIKAYNRMSEDLSDPADVILDVWPEPDEPLKIKIPEGLSAGDTFLIGDTNGRRSRATVTDSGGELGASFEPPATNPDLARYRHAALMEAVKRLHGGI